MDTNSLCHVYDWKIEKMSNTGELYFMEDNKSENLNQPSNREIRRPFVPPKRRVGRITPPDKTAFNRREGGSVMYHRPRQHEELRRTSSAETETYLQNELLVNENLIQAKCKCMSEFSLNHAPKVNKNNDLDNVIEFIQKLTSSRSMSSEKKLHYVSEILLNLDLDDAIDKNNISKRSKRRYSPSAKVIRKLSRKNSANERKRSSNIAELNRRLCRSLDNILDLDLNVKGNNYDPLDQTKSLLFLPNAHLRSRMNLRKDDDISVVPETSEMSSRESVDSTVVDGGPSNFYDGHVEGLSNSNNSNSNSATCDVENAIDTSQPFIVYNKHSRERSIDCQFKDDSDNEKEKVETRDSNVSNETEKTKENARDGFKRRSVTRIASKYKNRFVHRNFK